MLDNNSMKEKKGKTGYKTRKKLEVAERRKKVAIMYLRKMNQYNIAEELGVSQSLIHCDIKGIEKQWMDESKQVVDKHRAKAIANLDHLEMAAWDDEDLNLVLKILQEKNKINGVYAPERFEGKVHGGLTIMAAIKHALTYRANKEETKGTTDVEFKRIN